MRWEPFSIIRLPTRTEVRLAGTDTDQMVDIVSLEEGLETLSVSHLPWNGCPVHAIKDTPTANQSLLMRESPQILWIQLKRWKNDGSKQEHMVCT